MKYLLQGFFTMYYDGCSQCITMVLHNVLRWFFTMYYDGSSQCITMVLHNVLQWFFTMFTMVLHNVLRWFFTMYCDGSSQCINYDGSSLCRTVAHVCTMLPTSDMWTCSDVLLGTMG